MALNLNLYYRILNLSAFWEIKVRKIASNKQNRKQKVTFPYQFFSWFLIEDGDSHKLGVYRNMHHATTIIMHKLGGTLLYPYAVRGQTE